MSLGKASSAWRTFKDRDHWLELLLAADELSLGAKVVGSRIAHHHNIETGQCNPGVEKLVLGTGISQSSVRRHVTELEAAGWLRVDRTLGRYSNSYELLLPTLSALTGINPVKGERVQDTSTLSPVTPQPCQNRPNPVTHERQNSESITAKRTAKEIDSLRLDLGEEDSGRREVDISSPPDTTDDGFPEFYSQYPKRVARVAAEKAYRAVINKKLATPEQLLGGAMRYAAERNNQDPKFTKHASTWLTHGCWDDEPAKPIGGEMLDGNGNLIAPPPNQRTGQKSWMDIAMSGLNRGQS
jgi:hypothetical protein